MAPKYKVGDVVEIEVDDYVGDEPLDIEPAEAWEVEHHTLYDTQEPAKDPEDWESATQKLKIVGVVEDDRLGTCYLIEEEGHEGKEPSLMATEALDNYAQAKLLP